jgi:addiction module RelB/DinJ family antitoxin
MNSRLTVATAPKTSTFQIRVNPEIRKRVEDIYAGCGLTLTDAINLFFQQSLNAEGLPFAITSKCKAMFVKAAS